jgi:hypothetical protein
MAWILLLWLGAQLIVRVTRENAPVNRVATATSLVPHHHALRPLRSDIYVCHRHRSNRYLLDQ